MRLILLLAVVVNLNSVLTDSSAQVVNDTGAVDVAVDESKIRIRCGPNQIYDFCPSRCPVKTCQNKDTIDFECLELLKRPAATVCPRPRCRCADGFYLTDDGKCVKKEECPSKCGLNEVYDTCPSPCKPKTCETKDEVDSCEVQPTLYVCQPPVCRCADNYYRNSTGHCVTKEECPRCGLNEVYDECPTSCTPNPTCDNKDIVQSCQIPVSESGVVRPICLRPRCRCADKFYRNKEGKCVPWEECPKCKENEEYYLDCPVDLCRPKTCDEVGYQLPCYKSDKNITYSGKPCCICQDGFVRNEDGVCIPTIKCPSCGGDPNAQPGCGTFCLRCSGYVPCPRICYVNSCDCREGFVYDDINKKCIPKEKCPPQCKENEEYSTCPNNVCRPKTCREVGYPLPCFGLDQNLTVCEKPSCICKEGFVRNSDGVCVPLKECPSCGGDPNAQPGCGTFCNRCNPILRCRQICQVNGCDCREGYVYDEIKKKCVRKEECEPTCGLNEVPSECANGCISTCDNPNLHTVCDVNPTSCKPGCVCAKGFIRDGNNTCIPKDKCPPRESPICTGINELLYPCPAPSCYNQTCDNIGKKFDCPEIPSDYPCKSECRCKPGYYRNKNGICVTEKECSIVCGVNEVYSDCATNVCVPTCEQPSLDILTYCKINLDDCKPGCICAYGYLRDKNLECVPQEKCPPKICKPGTRWMEDCNQCYCDEKGIPICTKKRCVVVASEVSAS